MKPPRGCVRIGADTASVSSSSDGYELFETKIKNRISAPCPYPVSPLQSARQHTDVQVINSRAADEMLNIKGVKASFVVGENDEGLTVISARSLGDVNVQTIMEKLGGGGNLTKAGAQIEIPIEETIELIVQLVKEFETK